MIKPRRLLTIGHSYVVPLNRRLANEMQSAGAGEWDVTCVSPDYFHGSRDLRPVTFQSDPTDVAKVEALHARLTHRVHFFHYARLKQLLQQPWDVVHAWEEPFIFAGAQIAFHTPKQAALVYATFQNIPKTYPPPFNLLESYSMRRATGWIAFGNTVIDALARRPVYASRPHRLISPGVDVDRFAPDPAARLAIHTRLGWATEGPPVVGYLGRFIPEKGVALLMDVIAALSSKCRALFVGAGPMEPDLRKLQARYPDRVRICTDVGHADVPAYLNAMDILCAPSLTTGRWREQFGRMLVEGFATGLAVVGSNSGEIPHVIGDAGYVVPEGNTDAWRDALGDLLDNPDRRKHFARAGRDRARTIYAWPVIARQHLAFARDLLDARSSGVT